MQPYDEIKAYSDDVCRQIRWKKAKPLVAAEIENHIRDQRDAYRQAGDDEAAATQKAVLQMGDAVSVGLALDKTHRPRPQWPLIALSGGLMAVGAFFTYLIAAAGYSDIAFSGTPYLLAFGIFILCYQLDFTLLGRHPMKIYFGVLAVSLLGLLLGTGVNGRLVWVMGQASVTLSYLSLVFPLVFALLVYAMHGKGYGGILMCGLGFFPLTMVLMLVPTLLGQMMFTLSSLTVLCFAIAKGWFEVSKKGGLLLVLAPTAAVFVLGLCFALQNWWHRISVFLNPYQDPMGAGYVNSLIRAFLSQAVFWGQGALPQNLPDIGRLPGISTDYALVYFIHRFGFAMLLGIALCITLFSVLSLRGALRQKSLLGALIALSVLLTFILQSVFYIIGNLGYGLVASLSLPFVSYGRTALFINAALTGFMLSVFRTGDIYKDGAALRQPGQPLFSYENGSLIIHLKRE